MTIAKFRVRPKIKQPELNVEMFKELEILKEGEFMIKNSNKIVEVKRKCLPVINLLFYDYSKFKMMSKIYFAGNKNLTKEKI